VWGFKPRAIFMLGNAPPLSHIPSPEDSYSKMETLFGDIAVQKFRKKVSTVFVLSISQPGSCPIFMYEMKSLYK
jgi:hypothetical protein